MYLFIVVYHQLLYDFCLDYTRAINILSGVLIFIKSIMKIKQLLLLFFLYL